MDKFLLSILALLCLLPFKASADTASTSLGSSCTDLASWKINDDLTGSTSLSGSGSGSYSSIPAGGTVTITGGEGVTITKIVYSTNTTAKYQFQANDSFIPSSAVSAGATLTWTGSSQSVTYTRGSGNSALRLRTIAITYTKEEITTAPEAPVFSEQSGDIAAGTEVTVTSKGATTLHYVIDGGAEQTVESSSYTFTVDSDMSIEAWGENKIGTSSRETANYTTIIGAPVFTPAPGEVVAGTKITITSQGATKIFFKVNDAIVPQEWPADNCTYTVDAACKIEAWGEDAKFKQSEHKIVNYTIKTLSTTDYTLVKTMDDIAAGREYVIYGAATNNQGVMSKTLTDNKYFNGLTGDSNYTLAGEVISVASEDVALITLEAAADGKFYLKNQDGKYINSTSSASSLVDDITRATAYIIGFRTGSSENAIEIKGGGAYFTYNGSNTNRFRGYGSHQSPTFLYVKPKRTASLSFKESELTVYLSALVNGEEPVAHELVNPNNLPLERITFSSDKPEVVDIDDLFYEMIFKGKGKATITATYPGDDTYKEATASYVLNVELTKPMEQNEGMLEPPVPFDESGNWMKTTDFTNTGTDFIRFEHESGVEIYYSAVANIVESQPQAAPARVAAANSLTVDGETYTLLATEESDNKVSGTFNPYTADSGVDFTNGGTLKVLAKKGEALSQPHTFTFAAVPTGVEGIEADAADGAEYYTLQGVSVANPDKGIYIRVLNGKAVKVAL